MNARESLQAELKDTQKDLSDLYDIWEEAMATGTDENGDILIPEDVGIQISILLGV